MFPFAAFKVRQRLLQHGNSSHIVLIPIIELAAVDGAGSRQNLGISVFIETAPVAKLLSW